MQRVSFRDSARTVGLSNRVGVLSPSDFSNAQDFLRDPGGPITLPISYGEMGEPHSLVGPMPEDVEAVVEQSIDEAKRLYETPKQREKSREKRRIKRELEREQKELRRQQEEQEERERALLHAKLEREGRDAAEIAELERMLESLRNRKVGNVSITVQSLANRTGPVWRYNMVDLSCDRSFYWSFKCELDAKNYHYELWGPYGKWVFEFERQGKEALVLQMMQKLLDNRGR